MATKLNESAFDFAKRLVKDGRYVIDDRDAWSEHRPSSQDENAYLEEHGFREYGKWYLGIEDEEPVDTKAHYKFPYGDFAKIHRCGVISAESRAAQRKYDDIESAAAHLHGMLDGVK
ncbi:hypothetical protein [Actinopolymorpha pittospori]|jgi:hypothetical protein|uniref:Uncharacterized protein n=1 Tax=Actinopolymorpha pittospori TaxID=648752 RepID=A0A927MWG5_9ACTN|nr:hypothetical protein [Actinopolymorpha pittospori]MBE1608181.1 hypothetical protein [Actinopolymorpha pittospori]